MHMHNDIQVNIKFLEPAAGGHPRNEWIYSHLISFSNKLIVATHPLLILLSSAWDQSFH